MVPHQAHTVPLEPLAELVQGVLHRGLVAVSCLLQLTQRQRPVGAEQDGFERRGQAAQVALFDGLGSIWIGPKRSFWRTLINDLRRSSSTATNVTTPSSRSSASRITSTSSIGPPRTRCLIT